MFRKKLPEMLISSQRTTTIFWPERICFEMIEASRPRRWPLPSMTIGLEENVAIGNLEEAEVKTRMVEYAREVIVVADHSKLGQVTAAAVTPLSRVHTLITDRRANPAQLTPLREAGLNIVTV